METGTILDGRYVIGDTLADGVWLAQALEDDNKRVVVRQGPASPDELKALDHPGLARVLDVVDGCVVSDYVEGRDLSQILGRAAGFLPQVAVVRLFRQLCEALQYCHEHGVVAGNVRPDSFVLSSRGDARLVGFGLGRASDKSEYSPIEQWRGSTVDVRSDVYSLGATLYAMLTRKAPPSAVELVTGEVHLTPAATFNSAAAEFDGLIGKMMQASPQDRHQSVAEVLAEFSKVQAAAGEIPTTGMAAAWRESRRCRCGAVARGDTCPACGSRLERRSMRLEAPAPEPVAIDELKGVPDELLPQAPEVKALVQVPQGFMEALTSKAPEHEQVQVVDLTSQWVGFKASGDYAMGSILLIRLVVPLQAGADYRIIDGKITIDKCEPLSNNLKLYLGLFSPLVASSARLLDSYKEQERRHARRFDRICQIISKDLPDRKVLTMDISATGMAFLSSRNIPPGTPLHLTVDPDDATLPDLTVSVKVVSSVQSADRYRIGVQFLDVPDTSARVLRRFLKMTLSQMQ